MSKKDQTEPRRFFSKPVIIVSVSFLALLLVFILGVHFSYQNRVLPNQNFAGTNLSGLTQEQAEAKVSEIWQELATKKVEISYQGKAVETNFADLGFTFPDLEPTLDDLRVYPDNASFVDLLASLVAQRQVAVVIEADQTKAENAVFANYEQIQPMRNASFTKDEAGNWQVTPEQAGKSLVWDPFKDGVYENLLTNQVVEVTLTDSQPTLTAAMLASNREQLLASLGGSSTIFYDNTSVPLYWSGEALELVEFVTDDAGKVVATLSPVKWQDYVDANLVPKIETESEPLKLTYNEETGRVDFSSEGKVSKKIDRELLYENMLAALVDPEAPDKVEVPVDHVAGELEIDPKLQAMGINDLVAVGYTTYYGSTANRATNIAAGARPFNGIIVQPGETFSFNQNLGPVTAAQGYVPELVIKHDGTYPEYGGGLCQVSTTLYRTLLNADLPIVDRKPHSYAVGYYTQQLGHGLDATIYPGSSDLQFVNDTENALVMHTYVGDHVLYVNLYGTDLGIADVRYDGPYISNYRSPGGSIEIPDASLAPGQRVQMERPHTGFDVVWNKTIIYADGTEETKEIFSKYNAVPAKYRVGPSVTPTEVNNASQPQNGATLTSS